MNTFFATPLDLICIHILQTMAQGTIARIMDKGYGFIAQEGEEKDLFFHASAVGDEGEFNSLQEGDAVEFDVEEGDKGPHAVNVKRA